MEASIPIENDKSNILILSIFSFLVIALGLIAVMGCICCKRRRNNQKSELAGVEGIVKLKSLDDSNLNVSIDTTDSRDPGSTKFNKLANKNKNATLPLDAFKLSNGFPEFELKRSSAAPHRSLPDIPAIVEAGVCDNNSELYATVGDKLQEKESLEKSPSTSPSTTKKLANLSQHSSLSQADDVSSPYARVKSPNKHAYDKVKKSKHPYAQVIQPATAGGVAQVENIDDEDEDEDDTTIENPISHRESSNNDLLSTAESHLDASAAISGRISASQELPYMTPPIMNIINSQQPPSQHFSGDSQDSSKGYTSISVREPLANIIAQTNQQRRRREMQDSHYATVSDDSDEMYAAIEDPNNAGVDLYTSGSEIGSETYAQIQAPMTVSVEINAVAPPPTIVSIASSQTSSVQIATRSSTRPQSHHEESSAQIEKSIHSRQASSSSCTSSINIGSPKPEKRQANSPLPPTPKGKAKDSNNNSNKTRQEVEGMYAKVMKKNKLSSVTFESASPVLSRHEIDAVDGIQELKTANEYETIDKKRNRSRNCETTDVGYETIPADRNNNKEQSAAAELPHYAQIGEKFKMKKPRENEEHLAINDDPKYETLKLTNKQQIKEKQQNQTIDSDYDPNYDHLSNYEIVKIDKIQRISSSSSTSSTLIDDGYSQIGKKQTSPKDDFSDDDESIPGYSIIKKPDHNYSSIGESLENNLIINDELDTESNIYSSIPAVIQAAVVSPSTDSNSSDIHLDYEQITSSSVTPTTANNNYETLSISESSTATEEQQNSTLRHGNTYERLYNEKGSSPDIETTLIAAAAIPSSASIEKSGNGVDDFFKV